MPESVLAEIVRRKRSDVEARLRSVSFDARPTRRSLRAALARHGARFIMEVKKASPSGHRAKVGIAEAVDAYAPIADAVSVLTDGPFFSGSLDDLRAVRARFDGPILAKDFIVDPRQVAEARLHGADAVLAMLSVLGDDEAARVVAEARRLRMDVIVEVHDETEVQRALALGADIIGINNRDLRTLETNLGVTERLAKLVPDDRVLVSESGMGTRADVERLSRSVDAFLVGSSLMASDDIAFAARALVHGPVKICGLTSADDARAAADAGATHAGFVFVAGSARQVEDNITPVVAEATGKGLKAVGVFRVEDAGTVAATANHVGLNAVQLHGGYVDVADLRCALPAGCEIWSACGVGEAAEPQRPEADRTLFDTRLNGRTGGTGQAFDWTLVADRPDLSTAFLAGGIGPPNARAAQQVGAFGIDLSSGVESAPGRKDPQKIAALFGALRPQCRKAAECA